MPTGLNDGLDPLLAKVEHPFPIGIIPNKAHQEPKGFLIGTTFQLAVVEFDDQGRCYERKQLDLVSQRVEQMRTDAEDAIILVFVHGWKHDARTDDANLTSFRGMLARTAEHERN